VVDRGDAVQRELLAARVGSSIRVAPSVGPRVRASIPRDRAASRIGGKQIRLARRRAIASAERGESEHGEEVCLHGLYLCGSSAERKARITSSRLCSLISSSAKSVRESSADPCTALSLTEP